MKSYRYYVYTFMHGIKNCVRWFPIIWFDRDYQENHIYIILLKKIDNKIKYFQIKDDYGKKSDEVSKQLLSVRSALLRLIEDDYYSEACAIYGIKLNLNYNNVGIMKQDIAKVFELERELRQQDVDVVFSEDVSSKIHGWWD